MRSVLLLGGLLCVGVIVAGGALVVNADLIAHRPEVRRLGERLDWPGMYVMTTRGCFFRPDFERWQSRLRLAGGSAAILGAVSGAALVRLGRRSIRLAVKET